jgi:chromate transport protein ChrA
LGTILPSFIIILIIAIAFVNINDNPTLMSIFKGIRPAVVALIVAPVLSTAKSARLNRYTFIIPIAVALLIWMCGVSPIVCIIAGAAGGIALHAGCAGGFIAAGTAHQFLARPLLRALDALGLVSLALSVAAGFVFVAVGIARIFIVHQADKVQYFSAETLAIFASHNQ